jgi:arylsulfatase A-like enzyme
VSSLRHLGAVERLLPKPLWSRGLSVPRENQPNILLFMADQLRWDALGCVGGWVETPHVDALAASGVRFANAYTNAPVCIPARVSLALGRYPHQHGVRTNREYTLSPKKPMWTRSIREAGYATSIFGKTHLHPHKGDLRTRRHLLNGYGFDHVDEIAGPRASTVSESNLTDLWKEADVYEAYRLDLRDRLKSKPWVSRPSPLPLDLYPDVYVGRQASNYLRAYDSDRPWFCFVSFSGPHEPWDAPEPYSSRYDPDAMPPPIEPVEDAHDRPTGVLDHALETKRRAFEPGDVARLRANYAGNVSLIDDQVGAVLAAVDERGERDRTVVVFVSDHGEMNGDYGLLYKSNFLNGSVRVPFVIDFPAVTGSVAGQVAQTPIELMDLGATLVEAAGARLPRQSRARSAISVLRDPGATLREVAVSELRKETMAASTDWKLGLNNRQEAYLLFDLRNDPDETRNLAGLSEAREAEEELRQRLDTALKAAR